MPYFGLTGGWLTFWVTVACATDMTLFGYDQGVFGGVIVTPDFLETLGITGNTSLQGTITALYDIGCFFGAIAAFVIGEPLGRKKSILYGTVIMSVGAILQITAYSVPQMIIGRIVAGIGNGIVSQARVQTPYAVLCIMFGSIEAPSSTVLSFSQADRCIKRLWHSTITSR